MMMPAPSGGHDVLMGVDTVAAGHDGLSIAGSASDMSYADTGRLPWSW
jgi:hypothetical protein